jgi:hypothetical protein
MLGTTRAFEFNDVLRDGAVEVTELRDGVEPGFGRNSAEELVESTENLEWACITSVGHVQRVVPSHRHHLNSP